MPGAIERRMVGDFTQSSVFSRSVKRNGLRGRLGAVAAGAFTSSHGTQRIGTLKYRQDSRDVGMAC